MDRATELERYERLYQVRSGVMSAPRREYVQSVLGALAPKGSLIDVGAQGGHGCRIALGAGFMPVLGVEPTERFSLENPGLIVRGHAAELPVEDKSFDYLTCWDVIEHLVPDDVELALREFGRVARRSILLTASDCPSVVTEGGESLHPSARSVMEWDCLFKRMFSVSQVKYAGRPRDVSPAWRIDLG